MDYEESDNYKKLTELSKDDLNKIFSEMSVEELVRLLDIVNGVDAND